MLVPPEVAVSRERDIIRVGYNNISNQSTHQNCDSGICKGCWLIRCDFSYLAVVKDANEPFALSVCSSPF